MILKQIDHICLLVSDIHKAKLYYEKIFDFKCNLHPNDKNILMVESEFVHFFLKETSLPQKFLKEQHISFEVENIDKIIDVLKENNITDFERGIFSSFKYKNYKWLEWKDPDGIRLEVIEII
jgi:catechol 2,3-dioxygenase-like lactoylglutathione lyase family enzyme